MKTRNLVKRKGPGAQAAREKAFLDRALARSIELRSMGDIDYAYRLLERIGQRFPLAFQIHYGMGCCALDMGAYGNAIQGFAAAVLIAPEFADAKLGYAETLAAGGADEQAVALVKEILSKNPQSLGARLVYGKIYEIRGEWNRALGQYREVDHQDTDPRYAELLNRIGFCYLNMEDPARAIDIFSEAVTIQPENPDFLFNRGHCYGALGNFADALSDFETVVKLDSKDAEALALAALYLFYQGDRHQALARVEKALEMWPENPEIIDIREEILADQPPQPPSEEDEEE